MTKVTYSLEAAQKLAADLISEFSPYCKRIAVAGSIRRNKPMIGDIEMVAEPVVHEQKNLFGEVEYTISALEQYDYSQLGEVVKVGEKYKQIMLKTTAPIQLDLFIVLPPAQWGVIYTIRTGPLEFSKWLMSPMRYGGAMPDGMRSKEGSLYHHTRKLHTPNEEDVFRAIGLTYIPPEDRDGFWGRRREFELVKQHEQ